MGGGCAERKKESPPSSPRTPRKRRPLGELGVLGGDSWFFDATRHFTETRITYRGGRRAQSRPSSRRTGRGRRGGGRRRRRGRSGGGRGRAVRGRGSESL